MKKLLFSLLATAACSSLLQADVILKERVEEGPGAGEMVLKMKGDKIRIDVGTNVSNIFDADTKTMLTLVHPQKQSVEISGSMLEATANAMKQGGEKKTDTPLTPLNKSEEIDGYKTEAYSVTQMNGAMEMTFWVAKDHPSAKLYLETAEARDATFDKFGLNASMGVSPVKLPGVPLKTEVKAGGNTVVSRFVSIEEKDLADSDFQSPEGYTAVQAPALPAAPVAPAP